MGMENQGLKVIINSQSATVRQGFPHRPHQNKKCFTLFQKVTASGKLPTNFPAQLINANCIAFLTKPATFFTPNLKNRLRR